MSNELDTSLALSGEAHASAHHEGPHIPDIQGEAIHGFSIAGIDITNTVFSTWIFMAFLLTFVLIFYIALRTQKLPRIRSLGLDIVNRFDTFLTDALGEKRVARRFLPLVAGFFVFIFLGNVF